MNAPLTNAEREALASLLEMAADEFSNHGCNDFPLPNTPGNQKLLQDCMEWGSDEEETPIRPDPNRRIYGYDWMLMRFLAARLKGEI